MGNGNMKRKYFVCVAGLILAGCLSKPEAWIPATDQTADLARGDAADGVTGVDVVDIDAAELALTDAGADLPDTASDLPDAAPDLPEAASEIQETVVEAETAQPVDISPDEVSPDLPDVVEIEPDLCQPQCEGKECGGDGCGSECGTCPGAAPVCHEGLCCAPQCDGKQCGDDGCGSVCGECGGELVCIAGSCSCETGSACGQNCCPDGQGCLDDDTCCTPGCLGDECGVDECGNSCGGDCPEGCWCEGNTCQCDCPDEGDCEEGEQVCLEDDHTYHPCNEIPGCPGIWQINEAAIFECPGQFPDCLAGKCYGASLTCDDQNACTTNHEEQFSGECLYLVIDCDDGDPDTIDSCDGSIGCQNHPKGCSPFIPDPCIDYWTDIETGNCMETPKDCDDEDPCTEGDFCDPDTGGCVNIPVFCPESSVCISDGSCCVPYCEGKLCGDDGCEGTCGACDAGWECDAQGQCLWGGDCMGAESQPCDDGNPCTLFDKCMAGKCKGEANCNDKNPCTIVDTCVDGTHCEHTEVDCDDGNPCTVDWCNPDTVLCVHDFVPVPCDDGDPCTVNDACVEDVGCAGAPDAAGCDWDHDGVPDEQDGCPYVFSAGGVPGEVCPPWDEALPLSRVLTLSEGGVAPVHRRTFQPVEVALVSGLLDASTIGYWKLDGGTAQDSSDNGQHGTLSATPPTTTDGAFGDPEGALSFNGFTSSVTLADGQGPGLGLNDSRTLSLWFNVNMHIEGRRLFDDQSAAGSHRVVLGAGTSMQFVADTDFGESDAYCGEIMVGQWHHVAVVLDGASLACYLDGQLQGTGVVNDMATGAVGTALGAAADGKDYFAGKLDEVILASRAWKPDEVTAYFRSGTPLGTRVVPGAQRDFDDVRVTENPGADGGDEFYARSELVGVRPHSDSDTAQSGVVAQWAFDGGYTDLQQGFTATPGQATTLVRGRFGEANGALAFGPGAPAALVGSAPAFNFASGSQTLETWFRGEALGAGVVYLIDKRHSATSNAYALGYASNKAYCEYKSPGSVIVILGKTQVLDTNWHHAACVLDREGGKARLYLDGLLDGQEDIPPAFGSMQHTDPLRLGIGAGAMQVEMDEVLIHNVALTPLYFYNRTHPSVPTVRFLASTVRDQAAGVFPYHEYTLRWGDPQAQPASYELPDPQGGAPCTAVASHCNGWLGWWRFEEGSGRIAVDSSANENHGEFFDYTGAEGILESSPSYVRTPEGFGALFGQDNLHVAIPDSGSLSSPQNAFAIEAAARLDEIWAGQDGNERSVFVHRGACDGGTDKTSYQLSIYGNPGPSGPPEQDDNLAVAATGLWQFSPPDTAWPDGLWHTFYGALAPDSVTLGVDEDTFSYSLDAPADTLIEPGQSVYLGAFFSPCNGWLTAPLHGTLDHVRIMNRGLFTDEFLGAGAPAWEPGEFAKDPDGDGVPTEPTLPVCTGGQVNGCSDNCPDTWNPDQADGNTVGEIGNACCGGGDLEAWSHCVQVDIAGVYPDDFAHRVVFDVATAPDGLLASGGTDILVADGTCGVCYAPGLSPTQFPHWLDHGAGQAKASLWFNTETSHPTTVAVYFGNANHTSPWGMMDIFMGQVPAVQLAWTGDLEPDGKFTDSSGYGRHGQKAGGAAADPDGKFGDCIKTNSGYVVSPDVVLSAGIPASFSVAAWVKVPNTGTRTVVSEFGNPMGKGRFHLDVVGGKVEFVRHDGGPIMKSVKTSDDVVPNDQWFHLGATYSGVEDKLRIFVNGTERGTQQSQEMPPVTSEPVQTLAGANEGPSDLLDGRLDDVTLHSQKLQVEDMQNLYKYKGHATPANKGYLLLHKVASPQVGYVVVETY